MKTILLTFLLLIFSLINAHSQNACLDSVSYMTKNMGDGKEQLPFPSIVTIKGDTLSLGYGVLFKITSKRCEWNKERSQGISTYQVASVDDYKRAVITVSFLDKKQIIIIYDFNTEPIILEI